MRFADFSLSRTLGTLVGMLLLLLLAATSRAGDNSIRGATPEVFVGGSENLELVRTATTITVFRIVDSEQKPRPKKVVTIDGVKCHAATVTVQGDEVEQVIEALSDMTNFGGMFMCVFEPGLILRFAEEQHTLDLMICFHCREMLLYRDQALVRRPYEWAQTKVSFRKDARRAFIAVAKKAFPKDAEMQALE